jgi:cell division protein FtsB
MAILGGGERDLTIKLFANVDNFQKNMKGAQKDTEDFSGKVIDRLGKVGIAVAAAGAAVGAFAVKLGVDSVKAAMAAEQQQARLATILSNTGANEKQIKALNDQAAALGSVGVATRDSVTITQSQLATFDLKAKTIGQLTPAIIDYVIAEKGATASTDDFRSMTNGLAQALNGNFASLTASGFVLDANTKELIKNGTETERAAALVEVLDSTYKGFNETISQTSQGQLIKLQNSFNDLKVEIGEALLPFVVKLFEAFQEKVFPEIKKFTKYVLEETVPALQKYLTPRIERLSKTLGNLTSAFSDTNKAMFETGEGVNLFGAILKEIGLSVIDGFLNIVNALGIALAELTRILGFFFVLFTQFNLDKAIAVLNFEQHKLNKTVGDAHREFLKYQQQLDTTTSSLASAYRELQLYNKLKVDKSIPATKTENDLLKEQIAKLKEQLEALNANAGGTNNLNKARGGLITTTKALTAAEKELAALRAGGAIPSAISPDLQRFYRSELSLISQFGGLIGGINLNPSDPFFGFGQGGNVNKALESRAGGSARATGGVNINVVGTVIDPEGAARAIEQLIRDSEARGGQQFEDLFGVSP